MNSSLENSPKRGYAPTAGTSSNPQCFYYSSSYGTSIAQPPSISHFRMKLSFFAELQFLPPKCAFIMPGPGNRLTELPKNAFQSGHAPCLFEFYFWR